MTPAPSIEVSSVPPMAAVQEVAIWTPVELYRGRDVYDVLVLRASPEYDSRGNDPPAHESPSPAFRAVHTAVVAARSPRLPV